jgi:hypothetical protein
VVRGIDAPLNELGIHAAPVRIRANIATGEFGLAAYHAAQPQIIETANGLSRNSELFLRFLHDISLS